jgi:hypothetical protein
MICLHLRNAVLFDRDGCASMKQSRTMGWVRSLSLVGFLACSSVPSGFPCQGNANCPASLVCSGDCRCLSPEQAVGRCGGDAGTAGGVAGSGVAGGIAAGGGSPAGGGTAGGGSGGGSVAPLPYGEPCLPTEECRSPYTCEGASTTPLRRGVCSQACPATGSCMGGFTCSSSSICLKPCVVGRMDCGLLEVCDRSALRVDVVDRGACVPQCESAAQCLSPRSRCVNGLCCGTLGSMPCASGEPCVSPAVQFNGLCTVP